MQDQGQSVVMEDYDGPEEDWMTWEPNHDLRLLREDFTTMMANGNDAVDEDDVQRNDDAAVLRRPAQPPKRRPRCKNRNCVSHGIHRGYF